MECCVTNEVTTEEKVEPNAQNEETEISLQDVSESEQFHDEQEKECDNANFISNLEDRLKTAESKNTILEERLNKSLKTITNLETSLKLAESKYEKINREKEMMVIKYATNEKSIIESKSGQEKAEKKVSELKKEVESLQSKNQHLIAEKNKMCCDLKSSHYDIDRLRTAIANLDTKLKWTQNNYKLEIENHKETVVKNEKLTEKVKEYAQEIERVKKETAEQIQTFYKSQENRAHVLDVQLQEQTAALILERHELQRKEQHIQHLNAELAKAAKKINELTESNNIFEQANIALKAENEDLIEKYNHLEELEKRIKSLTVELNEKSRELEETEANLSQSLKEKETIMEKCRELEENILDLQSDIKSCRTREAEILKFTEKLTTKNVQLQSEFSAIENKAQQLSCELSQLRRSSNGYEERIKAIQTQLDQEKAKRVEETQLLAKHLAEKTKLCEEALRECEEHKSETLIVKRKYENQIKELFKELQSHKRKEHCSDNDTNSRFSSNSSLNADVSNCSPKYMPEKEELETKDLGNELKLDQQALIKYLIKLQHASAKKSEKIDFLEEHINTLTLELKKKSAKQHSS